MAIEYIMVLVVCHPMFVVVDEIEEKDSSVGQDLEQRSSGSSKFDN